MLEEAGISRRHEANKELSVWSSRKQYEFLEKLLDKYSAGGSVARQAQKRGSPDKRERIKFTAAISIDRFTTLARSSMSCLIE